jgi:hypothetical protein
MINELGWPASAGRGSKNQHAAMLGLLLGLDMDGDERVDDVAAQRSFDAVANDENDFYAKSCRSTE